MRALSIRQPYAELILRGIKRIEYRSRPTKIVGQRFYIYAARKWAGVRIRRSEVRGQRSDTAIDPASSLTSDLCPLTSAFPTGVIVGSAVIGRVTNGTPGVYEWHLKDVKRFKRPRRLKPGVHPQPVWFRAG